jgi:hypothetical protein
MIVLLIGLALEPRYQTKLACGIVNQNQPLMQILSVLQELSDVTVQIVRLVWKLVLLMVEGGYQL